ncbi:hypothetical protein cyc_05257 [Cyclospora cayetanensis]|uniref:Uncharacterized protein n=1 Tax=Cyclospora cayetanensis TaxID=88456 RepID=A0A1D3CRI8_9EIME|nr:hypothetical protein cyc_05257 [Cyclospora cayetanensis]
MWESEPVPLDSSPLGRRSASGESPPEKGDDDTPKRAQSSHANEAGSIVCSQMKESSWNDGIMMMMRQHHCPKSPSEGAKGVAKPPNLALPHPPHEATTH